MPPDKFFLKLILCKNVYHPEQTGQVLESCVSSTSANIYRNVSTSNNISTFIDIMLEAQSILVPNPLPIVQLKIGQRKSDYWTAKFRFCLYLTDIFFTV